MRETIGEMWPVAVKPIGLTGGKGVKVSGDHVHTVEEAVRLRAGVHRRRVA